jgi:hypothetical protein
MNYKNAITQSTGTNETHLKNKNKNKKLQQVIKYTPWEGRPGWVKITGSYEYVVPLNVLDTSEKEDIISLDGFVRLQEKRILEYDSTRWEGAFRELYPIYPPYPEDDYDEKEEYSDGSDSEYYYSDVEY